MARWSICFLTMMCVSCLPQKPPQEWTGIVRIIPVIITDEDGNTRWTEEHIQEDFETVNKYWEKTGIQFRLLPATVMEDPRIFDQNGILEWNTVMFRSRQISLEEKAYAIHFVNTIIFSGRTVGGMSTTPDVPFGFQYGTSISSRYLQHTKNFIAHELGHAWNLRHVWSDKHSDTPSEDYRDCNENIQCNIMSYCAPSLDCQSSPFLTKQQIEEVRRWSLSSARIAFLDSETSLSTLVLPTEKPLAPETDPPFPQKNAKKRP